MLTFFDANPFDAVRTHPAFSKSRINVGSFLACGYLLGQDPGFFEAEISLPITYRLTYNNMIKETDLKNASGFSDATCKPGVGFRRAYIAWMVVLCGVWIYVRCAGDAFVCEPFSQACLIDPQHITAPLFFAHRVCWRRARRSQLLGIPRSVEILSKVV